MEMESPVGRREPRARREQWAPEHLGFGDSQQAAQSAASTSTLHVRTHAQQQLLLPPRRLLLPPPLPAAWPRFGRPRSTLPSAAATPRESTSLPCLRRRRSVRGGQARPRRPAGLFLPLPGASAVVVTSEGRIPTDLRVAAPGCHRHRRLPGHHHHLCHRRHGHHGLLRGRRTVRPPPLRTLSRWSEICLAEPEPGIGGQPPPANRQQQPAGFQWHS